MKTYDILNTKENKNNVKYFENTTVISNNYQSVADDKKISDVLSFHTEHRCLYSTEYTRLIESEGEMYVVSSLYNTPRKERFYVVYPYNKDTIYSEKNAHDDTLFLRISNLSRMEWMINCFPGNAYNAYQNTIFCDWDMKDIALFSRFIANEYERSNEEKHGYTDLVYAPRWRRNYYPYTDMVKKDSSAFALQINAYNKYDSCLGRTQDILPVMDVFQRFILTSDTEKETYVYGGKNADKLRLTYGPNVDPCYTNSAGKSVFMPNKKYDVPYPYFDSFERSR